MKVICISGKARHGKDTTASIMKECLEDGGNKVLVAHYGDLVKYICEKFFEWNGVKDEYGRHILQYVGTDIVRKRSPDYWVDFILSVLNFFEDEWDYVLIPDTRFPNEINRISREYSTTHVRVVRSDFSSNLTDAQKNHPSETALDDCTPDFLLYNDGDINTLKTKINTWIKEIIYAD